MENVDAPKTAFISGHLDLTAQEFFDHYELHILQGVEDGDAFIVGDAPGADTLAQQFLAAHTVEVTVYHMLEQPRNNIVPYPTKGGFTSDSARDKAMTAASDYDIAWVRPGREKSGTARNLERRKKGG